MILRIKKKLCQSSPNYSDIEELDIVIAQNEISASKAVTKMKAKKNLNNYF